MAVIILLVIFGVPAYRAFDRWRDRRAATLAHSTNTVYQHQILRWVAGKGPDPREAMFCNGVAIEPWESPELSSLSWTPPVYPAPSPTPTPMTGSSTGTGSNTATFPG